MCDEGADGPSELQTINDLIKFHKTEFSKLSNYDMANGHANLQEEIFANHCSLEIMFHAFAKGIAHHTEDFIRNKEDKKTTFQIHYLWFVRCQQDLSTWYGFFRDEKQMGYDDLFRAKKNINTVIQSITDDIHATLNEVKEKMHIFANKEGIPARLKEYLESLLVPESFEMPEPMELAETVSNLIRFGEEILFQPWSLSDHVYKQHFEKNDQFFFLYYIAIPTLHLWLIKDLPGTTTQSVKNLTDICLEISKTGGDEFQKYMDSEKKLCPTGGSNSGQGTDNKLKRLRESSPTIASGDENNGEPPGKTHRASLSPDPVSSTQTSATTGAEIVDVKMGTETVEGGSIVTGFDAADTAIPNPASQGEEPEAKPRESIKSAEDKPEANSMAIDGETASPDNQAGPNNKTTGTASVVDVPTAGPDASNAAAVDVTRNTFVEAPAIPIADKTASQGNQATLKNALPSPSPDSDKQTSTPQKDEIDDAKKRTETAVRVPTVTIDTRFKAADIGIPDLESQEVVPEAEPTKKIVSTGAEPEANSIPIDGGTAAPETQAVSSNDKPEAAPMDVDHEAESPDAQKTEAVEPTSKPPVAAPVAQMSGAMAAQENQVESSHDGPGAATNTASDNAHTSRRNTRNGGRGGGQSTRGNARGRKP